MTNGMTFYGTRSMWDSTLDDEKELYKFVVIFDTEEEFQRYLNDNLSTGAAIEKDEDWDSAPIGAPYHD